MNRTDIEKAACEFVNSINILKGEDHNRDRRLINVCEYYSFIAGAEYMQEQMKGDKEVNDFIRKPKAMIDNYETP